MDLLRNVNPDGLGKYAVINLQTNQVEWGRPGDPNEFFVIKLKDRYAQAALLAYADAAQAHDPQYAQAVRELASRAGPNHPLCKIPD